jgi:hypothetical protein
VRACLRVFQSLLIMAAVLIMQYRHKKACTIMGAGLLCSLDVQVCNVFLAFYID